MTGWTTQPRRRTTAACLLAGVVAIAAASCDQSAGGSSAERRPGRHELVIAQVPVGATATDDFRQPYPAGSRVVVWAQGDAAARVLSAGLSAAGGPAVSADGLTVLFAGRPEAGAHWGIYEASVNGQSPRRLTPEHFNALFPAPLPGGRLIFSADAHGQTDPADGGPAFALYTCKLDGSELTRITFNAGSDIEPAALWDNRVLYATRQVPESGGAAARWIIHSIRSDGTMSAGFVGMDDTASYRRPRELPGRRIALSRIDDQGRSSLQTVGQWRPTRSMESAAGEPVSLLSAAGSENGQWLVTSDSEGTAGVRIRDGASSDAGRLVHDDPAYVETDALPLSPNAEARGFISMLKPEGPGQLLCLDARLGSNPDRSPRQYEASRLRIYRGDTASDGSVSQQLVVELPLASDGSVFAREVPSNVPLRFETVDAAGNRVQASHSWVWVRPGEIRGCIGCHENPETAPDNRIPQAVKAAAGAGSVVNRGGM